jgi:hypothetical protein
MRIVLAVALTAVLGGCAGLTVSDLGAPPAVDANSISVIDKRSPDQKESRRESVMSPLSVLGDANVNPPALLFLQSSVQKYRREGSQLRLEVDEFYVIDFFPKRLKAATSAQGGWLTNALVEKVIHSNTDWNFVNNIGVPTNGDSIVCLFAGTINGRAVKTAVYEEYRVSPMAMSIRNDPAFTDAVRTVLDKTASRILVQGGQLEQPTR